MSIYMLGRIEKKIDALQRDIDKLRRRSSKREDIATLEYYPDADDDYVPLRERLRRDF